MCDIQACGSPISKLREFLKSDLPTTRVTHRAGSTSEIKACSGEHAKLSRPLRKEKSEVIICSLFFPGSVDTGCGAVTG